MFLRKRTRRKNGKTHRYWSVVEARRLPNGKPAQKHLHYLGELNDVQYDGREGDTFVTADGAKRRNEVVAGAS